jgi:hypothetical protein
MQLALDSSSLLLSFNNPHSSFIPHSYRRLKRNLLWEAAVWIEGKVSFQQEKQIDFFIQHDQVSLFIKRKKKTRNSCWMIRNLVFLVFERDRWRHFKKKKDDRARLKSFSFTIRLSFFFLNY